MTGSGAGDFASPFNVRVMAAIVPLVSIAVELDTFAASSLRYRTGSRRLALVSIRGFFKMAPF